MKTYVKATFSLDPITMREVNTLASTWGVPKSEVIRRSIHQSMEHKDELNTDQTNKLKALTYLQTSSKRTKAELEAWMKEVREERHANGP